MAGYNLGRSPQERNAALRLELDSTEIAMLSKVGSMPFEKKAIFLKLFLDSMPTAEAISASNIAKRYKRYKKIAPDTEKPAKNRKTVPEATSAEAPSAEVAEKEVEWPSVEPPLPTQLPWFVREEIDLTNAVALDCEFVIVPNPMKPGKYVNEVASIGICDYYGNVLLDDMIYMKKGSYKVNQHTIKLNGIKQDTLEKRGKQKEEVMAKVKEVLRGRLIVGHSLFTDLRALDLVDGDIPTFDLQWAWWRTREEDDGRTVELLYKLQALYRHFFVGETFPAHNALQDAIATMRLFRECYVTDKMPIEGKIDKRCPYPHNDINP